jgi:hypothetical protein
MSAKITIRRNRDGEERVYLDTYAWEGWGDLVYQWTGGNCGCDCNRAIFFEEAGGEAQEGEDECGETVFSVRVEWNGSVVHDELTAEGEG